MSSILLVTAMERMIRVLRQLTAIELKDPHDANEVRGILDKYISLIENYDSLQYSFVKKLKQISEAESAKDKYSRAAAAYYKLVKEFDRHFRAFLTTLKSLNQALNSYPKVTKGDNDFYNLLYNTFHVNTFRRFAFEPIQSFADLIKPENFRWRLELLEEFNKEFDVKLKYEEQEVKLMEEIQQLLK